MCGENEDIVISNTSTCSGREETITISKNQSCGLGDNGYKLTKTSGVGCGSTYETFLLDDEIGRVIIDEVNKRRESIPKTIRRK